MHALATAAAADPGPLMTEDGPCHPEQERKQHRHVLNNKRRSYRPRHLHRTIDLRQ